MLRGPPFAARAASLAAAASSAAWLVAMIELSARPGAEGSVSFASYAAIRSR